MKSLSLFQDGNTIIHKIDPISKIIFILIAIFVPLILGTLQSSIFILIISVVSLIISGTFKKTLPIIAFSSIILITVVIIQGLFYFGNKTPYLTIGKIIFFKEGLFYALNIILRIYNIINAVSILMFTTRPSDLIESLIQKGLSPKIGYVFSSILQIIPQMMSTADVIMDAQRSRGLETEGGISKRIKAFIPLISPVVMNSLISTRERAMALEVRAFNSKRRKTFLNESKSYEYAQILQIILFSILIVTIIWRIYLWVF